MEFIRFSEILVTFYKQAGFIYPSVYLILQPISGASSSSIFSANLQVWERLTKTQMNFCHCFGLDPVVSIN